MDSILKIKKQAQFLSKKNGTKLKDSLEQLAKENNFSSWKDYKNSLDSFWYRKHSPFLTSWFVTHKEAKEYQDANGGFILSYKGQYFVATSEYIQFIGLDPENKVWEKTGFDATSPESMEKLIHTFKVK